VATSAQHIEARDDADLAQRLIAIAEQLDIPNAQMWVASNLGRLVATDIGETTIADVHAYAVATYVPTPRPGENPAAVTDTQLEAAITALTANP
jgi:hypothetical protein